MHRFLTAMLLFALGCGSSGVDDTQEAPSVVAVKNIMFASGAATGVVDRQLDVYHPSNPGSYPVAVVLHGGSGSKESASTRGFSEHLAEQDVVVFTPSYTASVPGTLIDSNGRVLREVLETAVCSVRYATQHAGDYGGNPARITVVGESAGGMIGLLASFLGGEMGSTWEAFEADRGNPPQQMNCASNQSAADVDAFIGFNGAYFIFKEFELSIADPALWAIANAESYIGTNPSLVVRFLFGSNDTQTPAWHVSDAKQFIVDIQKAGYDADTLTVEAGHNFPFSGSALDETTASILDAMSR